MGIEMLRDDVTKFLQQEQVAKKDAETNVSAQEAKVKRVVNGVLEKVVNKLGYYPETRAKILNNLSSLSFDKQQKFLSKFLEIQRGDIGACESVIADVAQLCVEESPYQTIQQIEKFGITNKDILIELAKQCAIRDGGGTAQYIERFGITNQEALRDIALLCAHDSGEETAQNIEKFKITKPEYLEEIARVCAMHGGAATAANIEKFKITTQEALRDIAVLCAHESGEGTAQNIGKFKITNQEYVKAIAKLCVEQTEKGIAPYIQNFGIRSQEDLRDLAIQCGLKSGKETAINIEKFGITNPEYLKEIAKVCARQDGKATLENNQNFKVTDKNSMVEIGIYCFLSITNNFNNLMGQINVRPTNIPPEIVKKMMMVYNNVKSDEVWTQIQKEIGELFDALLSNIKTKNGEKIEVNEGMLRSFLFFCEVLNKKDVLHNQVALDLVDALLSFKVPHFKKNILYSIIDLIVNDRLDEFSAFIKDKIPSKSQNKKIAYLFLLTVFNMEMPDKELKGTIVKEFLDALKKRSSFLLESSKTGSFIDFLHLLNDKIRKEKLQQVYRTFVSFDKATYSKNLFLFQSALALGIDVVDKTVEEVKELVYQKAQLPPGFEQIHEKLRNPECLFIYWNQMNLLPQIEKEPVLKTLQTYLQEVTNGTFSAQRYNESPQLKKMKEAYCTKKTGEEWEQFLSKWKESLPPKPVADFLSSKDSAEFSGYKVVNSDDHWDLFLCGTEVAASCQRVNNAPQINKDLLGYVLDGKIRIIAVKDPQGKIVSRSIVKLLWDDMVKQPVLLVERVYSNNSKLDPVVEAMAKEEAKRLGIEFINKITANGRRFQSYTNRTGMEYEDSRDLVENIEVPVH